MHEHDTNVQGMVSTSSAPTASSSGNEASSSAYPEINDMIVDVSRGMNASPVSAAVAAVIGRTPARSSASASSQDASLNMQRVLSAPLLSPPANAERTRSREGRVSSGLDQNAHRLPPPRQVRCEMIEPLFHFLLYSLVI